MIKIGKPYITRNEESSFLNARVFVSDDSADKWKEFADLHTDILWRTDEDYPPENWKLNDYNMFFEVSRDLEKYLITEVCDPFVVAIIYYAMVTGSDIECEAPMSEKLYYGITNQLIPLLCNERQGFSQISIISELCDTDYSEKRINGTGMSCGVDSMYTLYKYTRDDMPDSFKLGALTYLTMGAVFHPNMSKGEKYALNDFYAKTGEMADEKLQNAIAVGKETGLPVLSVKSNLDEDYYRGGYGFTGVYRNMACILALSKYFKKYYCSSAGWPKFYDPTLKDGSEHYEILMCPFLSTDSVEFILSDELTRLKKTAAIADYDISKKYLDVCFNFNNCGKCAKCYRTLITLELLGKLDDYSDCFDIEEYKNNRKEAYYWLLRTADKDSKVDNAVFANELLEIASRKKVIPFSSKLKYYSMIPVFVYKRFKKYGLKDFFN